MKDIHSDILEFRGSHYDFGVKQGKLLKDSVILDNRRKQWKAKRPRFEIDVQETKAVYQRFAPGIWAELMGLQESLGLPMEEVLRDFGGYRIDAMPSGCSIVTGTDFMVRNYDFHPQTYEGRFSLFQPTDGGYAIIGPTSRITGRMDGMNEKGLAMGYNFTHRKKPGDGFVCYLIGRIILETCATIHEAVELLREIPHRGSFSYIVTDTSGETRIIEASPRSVDVRISNICTNHFEIQSHENRNYLKDSFDRLEAIQNQESQTHNALEAFRLFNDTDKGVFSTLYKSWAGTIHTSAYLPKEKKVWFALGGNQQPVVFDFDSWLQGESLAIQTVYGTVDTDIGFAHVDKQFV
ncbi:peptidase C45 acyl-coenzyme A:6-aminopenicillanic acid acyl-transferase [Planococcus donghaensis MPA1U2]|uniref:Peptidase C45 acyl-coenzyme A:6-aminopenicillanic acid acyl-transferase n=1 Tax=Planococcus donghaensis MPA1U2 TaxID=933115 RepID=E7RH35_9BACL|nr:C45 family autoproteolytic acyltransferase/hydolase [Planococcus donghaensis]EGA89773.1 peptidase C45 acyl-coenzyme A:6-aminopenicillanic acid acyl-transferase [Planococcus donghaensis MPA1U2]